jgi:hypothetical protein
MAVNYSKLDAALVSALKNLKGSQERDLSVFIHTGRPLDADEQTMLRKVGVSDLGENKRIFTAMVSESDVEELSNQPWVKQIKLSKTLHPLR